MEEEQSKITLTMDKQQMLFALKNLRLFVSTEETRYYLCGVYVEYDKNADELILTATDGHKLCTSTLKPIQSLGAKVSQNAIIPTNIVDVCIKAIQESIDELDGLNFIFDNETFALDCFGHKVEGRCLDGTYPDYRRAIPKASDDDIVVGMNDKQFLAAAKVLKSNKQPMKWTFSEGGNVTVEPVDEEGVKTKIVLMPYRVNGENYNEKRKKNSARCQETQDMLETEEGI
jgi:DNA polymerase III sliding clamp (beta) subunit (PCNA family)